MTDEPTMIDQLEQDDEIARGTVEYTTESGKTLSENGWIVPGRFNETDTDLIAVLREGEDGIKDTINIPMHRVLTVHYPEESMDNI